MFLMSEVPLQRVILAASVDIPSRCRSNAAHIRQFKSDSGLFLQVKVLNTRGGVTLPLGSAAEPFSLLLLYFLHASS